MQKNCKWQKEMDIAEDPLGLDSGAVLTSWVTLNKFPDFSQPQFQG